MSPDQAEPDIGGRALDHRFDRLEQRPDAAEGAFDRGLFGDPRRILDDVGERGREGVRAHLVQFSERGPRHVLPTFPVYFSCLLFLSAFLACFSCLLFLPAFLACFAKWPW